LHGGIVVEVVVSIKTPEEMAEECKNKIAQRDIYAMGTLSQREVDYLKEAFLAGYQAAAPEWISVKDRLPDFEVLCVWVDVRRIAVDGLGARGVGDCEPWEEGYTHWMPIPELPKEASYQEAEKDANRCERAFDYDDEIRKYIKTRGKKGAFW
jgi:hypothetical protein